jgi:cytochrome c oxidase subunit III
MSSSSTPPGKSDRVGNRQASAFQRIERTHPLLMMLYLALMGITVLFAILVAAYLQTRHFHPLPTGPFPRFFALSTVLLVLSSVTLRPITRYYRKDNLTKTAQALGFTLALGLAFLAAQVIGWRELLLSGVAPRGMAAGTYIYLLSALHGVHLIAGITYLAYLWIITRHASTDGVRTLVFIRNPYRRLQLRLIRLYWHYMDLLWLALFLVLLFTI